MYIRTRDGRIVDTTKYPEHPASWSVQASDYALTIKEAETIEELCDEFVLHYGDTMQTSIPIPWATYERRDDNWQKHKEKLISELKKAERKATVYGAIWTSKGLIYVAKMDSDGKLVLI